MTPLRQRLLDGIWLRNVAIFAEHTQSASRRILGGIDPNGHLTGMVILVDASARPQSGLRSVPRET